MSSTRSNKQSAFGQDTLEPPKPIEFSNQVNQALEDLLPSTDIFDSAHFNSVDYINQLFPNEQSLEGIETFLLKVKKRVAHIDAEISYMVRKQSSAGDQAKRELEETKSVIRNLYDMIQNIKKKSEQSEQMVQSLTQDIRSLDTGKKNLSGICDGIKKLKELMQLISNLKQLSDKRQYAQIGIILERVNDLKACFTSYKDIRKVDNVFRELESVENNLKKIILEDFEGWDKFNESNKNPEKVLAEACQVVDFIGIPFREELIRKFARQQIQLYRMIFSDGVKKKSGLDVVSKRYNWCRKLINKYDSQYAKIFPDFWSVREELVVEFCLVTREDFSRLLTASKANLDATALYRSILQTTNFEREMNEKFHTRSEEESQNRLELEIYSISKEIKELSQLETKTPDQIKTLFKLRIKLRDLERQNQHLKPVKEFVEKEQKKKPLNSYNFLGMISTVFDDYMDVYIRYEDSQLTEAFDRIAKKEKWDGQGETKSHEDLLMFITSSMKSCTAFSKGKVLLKLVNEVWKKHVGAYAIFMSKSLPKLQAPQSNQNEHSFDLGRWIPQNETKDQNANSKTRLTEDEERVVCYMIHVAVFWLSNIEDLQEELQSKMEEPYSREVNFSDEMNKFYTVLKSAIEQLVLNLMAPVEDEFLKMEKMPLATMIEVVDQSNYIHNIISFLSDAFPYLAEKIPATNYKTLCDNFTMSIYNSYLAHIQRCKKISGPGTQQLLLDVTSLTSFLKAILKIGDSSRFEEDEIISFAKKVQQRASKVEFFLKVLLTPPEGIVAAYRSLIPNGSSQELQQILELQGLGKNERASIIEEYNQQKNNNNSKAPITGNLTSKVKVSVQDLSTKTKGISQQTNKMVSDSIRKFSSFVDNIS